MMQHIILSVITLITINASDSNSGPGSTLPSSLEQFKVKESTNDISTGKNSSLQFLDIPKGDDLKIHELQLEDELLFLEPFSSLTGYLLPNDYPIDIIRDAVKHSQTFYMWAIQIVKLEILAVAWIIFWAILSLSLPVVVLLFLCPCSNVRRLDEQFPRDTSSSRWSENVLGYLLHLLLMLIVLLLLLILITNERVSKTASKAPETASLIYEDLKTFVKNSQMQISFVTTSSTDVALEAVRKDLEDLDVYLGRPYQRRLSLETGMELTLNLLEKLKEDVATASKITSELLSDCKSASEMENSLKSSLNDISHQLITIQQQCLFKDRPLCFSLQFSGYDVTLHLSNLTSDGKVLQLAEMNREETFNTNVDLALDAYNKIPTQIVHESIPYFTEIKSVLSKKRAEVYKGVHDLDVLAGNLSQKLIASQEPIFTFLDNIVKWDLWRWLAILVIAGLVSLIWGVLMCAAPCGCPVTSRTVCLLQTGIVLCCFLSVLLWILGTAAVLVGGHGCSLICKPLYDHPFYNTLSEFLDVDGVFYPKNGFFEDLSTENDSLKIAQILRNCQRDQPVYHTFHLYNHFYLNSTLNYKSWNDLQTILDEYVVAKTRLEVLSPSLQLNLQILSTSTTANLTAYRKNISASTSLKEFSSFADQLNNVARQLMDPVIARRMDNLAFSVRNVVQDEMQRLNDLKERVLYKITMLEVLLPPLNRRLNQSLSHLKTIQFFLDNQAWELSEMTRRRFTNRIENYLEQLFNHTSIKLTKEIGKCRPLWEIFHTIRFNMCKLTFDPLNAIAFASHFLILVLLAITPVAAKLVNSIINQSHSNSSQGLLLAEEQVWNSPTTGQGSSPVEEPAATRTNPPPRTVSSRLPLNRIPQPPVMAFTQPSTPRTKRKLSAITSRISARNSPIQMPTTSKLTRSRRNQESLRLIEPTQRRSGSNTSGSWM